MPAPHAITPEKLSRLVGTTHCPRILDLRNAPERIIPGAVTGVQCGGATDKSVIVVDQEGGTMAIAAAAAAAQGCAPGSGPGTGEGKGCGGSP